MNHTSLVANRRNIMSADTFEQSNNLLASKKKIAYLVDPRLQMEFDTFQFLRGVKLI